MPTVEEGMMEFVVKLQQEHRTKNESPKLHTKLYVCVWD